MGPGRYARGTGPVTLAPPPPDDRTGEPSPADRTGNRRASALGIAAFVLTPPLAGSVIGSLLLSGPGREPWVITGAFLLGLVFFLLANPLGRRSEGFRIARYRRMAELAVLLGLTCGAVVVYALVVHTILGIRTPWAADLFRSALGG